jgi:hypothetical protein
MAEPLRQIVARFSMALSAGDTPGFVLADNKLFSCVFEKPGRQHMIGRVQNDFPTKHTLGLTRPRGRSPFGVAKTRGIMRKQQPKRDGSST